LILKLQYNLSNVKFILPWSAKNWKIYSNWNNFILSYFCKKIKKCWFNGYFCKDFLWKKQNKTCLEFYIFSPRGFQQTSLLTKIEDFYMPNHHAKMELMTLIASYGSHVRIHKKFNPKSISNKNNIQFKYWINLLVFCLITIRRKIVFQS
jgi:hypothetical protein